MRSTAASLAPDPPIVILPRLGAHDGNDASKAAPEHRGDDLFPAPVIGQPLHARSSTVYLLGSVKY
jgi:hypothetical protein